jgi:calcium-translocating P-type ATPase
MLYYNSSISGVLLELGSSEAGLSDSDASERLRTHGLNIIRVKGEPLWHKVIEPFASVFMLVLFIAVIISILHQDIIDAVIIIVIILVSALIYYIQRLSTARILKTLQKHTLKKVLVLRDGNHIKIDSSFLVPGDIISLFEGDKVPADARLVISNGVRTDESSLTGESSPISKTQGPLRGEKEIYEQSNILFQGSFIVAGEAVAVVLTTGNDTEFGQLAALANDTTTASPVQVKIDRLLEQIIIVVAGIAIVAFGLALYRGTEFTEAIRFVLAISVSAVPESLPVAISVILVLGMRRMALKKALVRDIRAIETVGVLTTIATDKTGTLTKNQLTVQKTWQPAEVYASLVTSASYSVNRHVGEKSHDPLDIAMINYIHDHDVSEPKGIHVTDLPFDLEYAMSGNVWQKKDGYHLYLKGSPETILNRSVMTESEREHAELSLHKLTAEGYRVIALAHGETLGDITTFNQLHTTKLEFIGFLAVADIIRPEARSAVLRAQTAGVTVRMITGDHFETAYHIGNKLGIVHDRSEVFDSRRMHTMTDDQLQATIEHTRVFSRVVPENKFRILSLLKLSDITAMTGDGVNDVPALANAHVGVAMGSGSEIAKDAGDIILLDNNFKSIIDAMREGRVVIANIKRMLFYLLSTNAGEALTALGALAIGLPIPLLPVQILWVNLVTDTLMVIPLGLEPGEKDIMKRQPKSPDAPVLSRFMVSRIILVALSMMGIALALYITYDRLFDENYARTIVFSSLVVMQWANAFNARSDYQSLITRLKTWNGKFYGGLAVAVLLQYLALFGPLRSLLHITAVSVSDLVLTGIVSFIVPIVVVEFHKLLGRHFFHKLL